MSIRLIYRITFITIIITYPKKPFIYGRPKGIIERPESYETINANWGAERRLPDSGTTLHLMLQSEKVAAQRRRICTKLTVSGIILSTNIFIFHIIIFKAPDTGWGNSQAAIPRQQFALRSPRILTSLHRSCNSCYNNPLRGTQNTH